MEECYLLACLVTFPIQPIPTCLRVALLVVGWVILYTTKLRKCLTDMATGQINGGNSSVEILSAQVTLGCVKLTAEADYDSHSKQK